MTCSVPMTAEFVLFIVIIKLLSPRRLFKYLKYKYKLECRQVAFKRFEYKYNNFNLAMNRVKAADITQLHYLFDMYLLCIL